MMSCFFTFSFAMDESQQLIKPYLERITVDQLDSFVRQEVLYKVNKYNYQNVILAKNIKGTHYCMIYTDESTSSGIVCNNKKLYKLNSEAGLPKN